MAQQNGIAVQVVREGVQARLQTVKETLPEAEQRVAAFVLKQPEEAVQLPVRQLAERIGVSEATIVRFCQSLGYRGLRDLKLALAAQTAALLLPVREDIAAGDDALTIARKLIQADMQMLANTLEVLDGTALERAVAALLAAPRIEFYGIGGSIPVVIDAHYRFARIGMPAVVVTDPYIQVASAALLPPGAVAFAVSHTGRSPETITALRIARAAGATCVLLTSQAGTPAGEHANIQLITAMRDDPLFLNESITGRMAHLCVLDALYTAVMNRRLDESLAALTRVRSAFNEKRGGGER